MGETPFLRVKQLRQGAQMEMNFKLVLDAYDHDMLDPAYPDACT